MFIGYEHAQKLKILSGTLSFEVNAFINCKILGRKGWINSSFGGWKFKVTRVPCFFQNQPYFLWASCLKVVFYCARKFSFLSCGYNAHIDIFNVPLLILRNKTLRKRVWKYPSWLNQKKSCLRSTAGSRCFESLLEKITGCCFHLTWSFYFRNIALKLESTSFSLAFPERQIKLRYLFGQVDRFETSIPNQKRGFNHVESRVCYFTVCVQGSCYSTEVNLYTLMPIDS